MRYRALLNLKEIAQTLHELGFCFSHIVNTIAKPYIVVYKIAEERKLELKRDIRYYENFWTVYWAPNEFNSTLSTTLIDTLKLEEYV